MQLSKLLHPLEQDRVRRAINHIMIDNNLTFKQVAAHAGVHVSTLRRFMIQRHQMGINALRCFLHFLHKRGHRFSEE